MTRISKNKRDWLKAEGLWVGADQHHSGSRPVNPALEFERLALEANEIKFDGQRFQYETVVNPEVVYSDVHMMFDIIEESDAIPSELVREDFEVLVLSVFATAASNRIITKPDVNPNGLLPCMPEIEDDVLENFFGGFGAVDDQEVTTTFLAPDAEVKALARSVTCSVEGSRVCDALGSLWLPVVEGDERTASIIASCLSLEAEKNGLQISAQELRPWVFSGFQPRILEKFSAIKSLDWMMGLSHFFKPYKDGPSFKSNIKSQHVDVVLEDLKLYLDDDLLDKLAIEKSLYQVTTAAHDYVSLLCKRHSLDCVRADQLRIAGKPSAWQLCEFRSGKLRGPLFMRKRLKPDARVARTQSVLWNHRASDYGEIPFV